MCDKPNKIIIAHSPCLWVCVHCMNITSAHTDWYLKDLYLSRVWTLNIHSVRVPRLTLCYWSVKYLPRVTITVDSDKDTDVGTQQANMSHIRQGPKWCLKSSGDWARYSHVPIQSSNISDWVSETYLFSPRHPDWPVMASSILTTYPPVFTDGLRVSNMEISWSAPSHSWAVNVLAPC